jgi:hypothetical protein
MERCPMTETVDGRNYLPMASDTTGQMTVSIPFRGFVSSDADEAGRAILTESVRVHAAVDVS